MIPEESAVGRRRDLVMSLMPFICLILFFTVVRTWLVWLLIPVAAVLLYGADGKRGRRHRPGAATVGSASGGRGGCDWSHSRTGEVACRRDSSHLVQAQA